MRTPLAFALVLVASPALAQKEYGFDNRKGSGQPYLKPEETVAKFKVADEFEVKLFAGRPEASTTLPPTASCRRNPIASRACGPARTST